MTKVLDFLLNYTEFHFANEETMFAKYNYPQSTAHKKERIQNFIFNSIKFFKLLDIRLTEQVKQYNRLHHKGKVTTQELSKFLQGWLINRIFTK